MVGKFGNVELSDVAAFVELPNKKVLSGTESGHLVLWDGNLIQFVVARPGGDACHHGMIEALTYDPGTWGGCLLPSQREKKKEKEKRSGFQPSTRSEQSCMPFFSP